MNADTKRQGLCFCIGVYQRLSAAYDSLSSREKRSQMTRAFGRPELPQRFGFNLPDSLPCDVEFLADLFQRMLPLASDPEPQADDLFFLGRKGFQNVRRLVTDVGIDHRIDGRTHPAVFDQIAQGRFAIAPYRSFKRHRIARNGLQLLDLL